MTSKRLILKIKKKYMQNINMCESTFFSGKGSQNKMFSEAEKLNHSCFICFQERIYDNKYTNTYKSFTDINEFLDYEKTIPNDERRFYELIKNECVEYYDLDFKMDEWFGDTKEEKIERVLKDFVMMKNEFLCYDRYTPDRYERNDLIVLESCGKNSKGIDKLSLHILVRPELNGKKPRYFQSIKDQKILQTKFQKVIKEDYTEEKIEIDLSVYNSNSLFRLNGNHKGDETNRKFKLYDKRKIDEKLLFCSYVNYDEDCVIKVNQEEKKIIHPIQEKQDELHDEEVLRMFEYLDVERWDNYQTCIELIWLGKKMGLSDKDVHDLCMNSSKYDDVWVQGVIDNRKDDKWCPFTIGTLLYYLKEDVDEKTFNRIVPKNNTYNEISNKQNKTDEEEDYIKTIKQRITEKNIKLLTHTEGYIERIDDKYVRKQDINEGKVCIVKAGLGKGKTTATLNHIRENQYDYILVLTPRRSYAKTTLSRMNTEIQLPNDKKFVLYLDVKGNIKSQYLIIQVESLHRFTEDINKGKTLLILDEVESLLYQMTSKKTHGKNHMENLYIFEKMIRESSKVLCMDAFISNKTIHTLNNLGIKFDYYNYTRQLEKRTAVEYDNKQRLRQKLINELESGKKIFFFCSSRKQLTDYFLSDIQDRLPEKKIIEYHSKKSSDLSDVNETWKEADLVICTCSITIGCNFDLEDVFSNIFVYASACSQNLIRDIFQSCYRVRHLIEKKLYFCLDTKRYGINETTNINQIREMFENRVYYHRKHYEKYLQFDIGDNTPKWIKDLLVYNMFEQNMSVMNIRELFIKYLEMCNYTIEDEVEDNIEDLNIEEEEKIKVDTIEYQDIPEITFSILKELLLKRKRETLTDMEDMMICKSFFQDTLKREDDFEERKLDDEITLWNLYTKYGGRTKFRNLCYEKGYYQGEVRIADIISVNYPELADNFSRKLEDIIEISNRFGLKNSQDTKKILRTDIESNLEWIRENEKRFTTNFNIRESRSKNGEMDMRKGIDLLNKILTKWGYSKIKSGKRVRKQIDGQMVDVTDFNNENTEEIDIYSNMKAKKIRETRIEIEESK